MNPHYHPTNSLERTMVDISLVPTEDLPLQDTLNFHPCPSDLATSYLQTLCLAEGFSVGRGALENLFGCVETQQGPLDSFTDRFPSSPRRFDLRHCITQLQFWLSGRTTTEPTSHILDTMIQHLPSRQKLLRDSTDIRAAERSPEDNAETLRQFRVFARTLDTASFINAELARNASHPMNVSSNSLSTNC